MLQQQAAMFGATQVNWPEGFSIKMVDGLFACNYSYRVQFRTPFGSYINIHVIWRPEIRDGKIDFTIKTCRVGDIDLKPSWVKAALLRQLAKNREASAQLTKLISSLYVNGDGLLVIRYCPYEIKLLVQEQMAGKLQGGKSRREPVNSGADQSENNSSR